MINSVRRKIGSWDSMNRLECGSIRSKTKLWRKTSGRIFHTCKFTRERGEILFAQTFITIQTNNTLIRANIYNRLIFHRYAEFYLLLRVSRFNNFFNNLIISCVNFGKSKFRLWKQCKLTQKSINVVGPVTCPLIDIAHQHKIQHTRDELFSLITGRNTKSASPVHLTE